MPTSTFVKVGGVWQSYPTMSGFAADRPCPDRSHTWTSSSPSLHRPTSLMLDSGPDGSPQCKLLSISSPPQSAKSCTQASPWIQSRHVPQPPLLPHPLVRRAKKAGRGSSLLTLKEENRSRKRDNGPLFCSFLVRIQYTMFRSVDLKTVNPASSSYLTVEDTGSRTIAVEHVQRTEACSERLTEYNIPKAAELWTVSQKYHYIVVHDDMRATGWTSGPTSGENEEFWKADDEDEDHKDEEFSERCSCHVSTMWSDTLTWAEAGGSCFLHQGQTSQATRGKFSSQAAIPTHQQQLSLPQKHRSTHASRLNLTSYYTSCLHTSEKWRVQDATESFRQQHVSRTGLWELHTGQKVILFVMCCVLFQRKREVIWLWQSFHFAFLEGKTVRMITNQ